MTKDELIEAAIEQIKEDLAEGDTGPLACLLENVSRIGLEAFLKGEG